MYIKNRINKISRILGIQFQEKNIFLVLLSFIRRSPLYIYYYIKRRKINVLTGLRKYELPLLISYSRSGTNWLRYIIEYASEKPTPGLVRLVSGDNYIIDRAHKGFEVIENYKKVLLIIRDYRECLIRQNQILWDKHKNVEKFLNDQKSQQPASWYIDNIKAFDKFSGEKLLIYYEDLITTPDREIQILFDFLNIKKSRLIVLLRNIDNVKRESIAAYTKNKLHLSITRGEKNKLTYHANANLTIQQQKEFDLFYKNNYVNIFEKYLSRYEK